MVWIMAPPNRQWEHSILRLDANVYQHQGKRDAATSNHEITPQSSSDSHLQDQEATSVNHKPTDNIGRRNYFYPLLKHHRLQIFQIFFLSTPPFLSLVFTQLLLLNTLKAQFFNIHTNSFCCSRTHNLSLLFEHTQTSSINQAHDTVFIHQARTNIDCFCLSSKRVLLSLQLRLVHTASSAHCLISL